MTRRRLVRAGAAVAILVVACVVAFFVLSGAMGVRQDTFFGVPTGTEVTATVPDMAIVPSGNAILVYVTLRASGDVDPGVSGMTLVSRSGHTAALALSDVRVAASGHVPGGLSTAWSDTQSWNGGLSRGHDTFLLLRIPVSACSEGGVGDVSELRIGLGWGPISVSRTVPLPSTLRVSAPAGAAGSAGLCMM